MMRRIWIKSPKQGLITAAKPRERSEHQNRSDRSTEINNHWHVKFWFNRKKYVAVSYLLRYCKYGLSCFSLGFDFLSKLA